MLLSREQMLSLNNGRQENKQMTKEQENKMRSRIQTDTDYVIDMEPERPKTFYIADGGGGQYAKKNQQDQQNQGLDSEFYSEENDCSSTGDGIGQEEGEEDEEENDDGSDAEENENESEDRQQKLNEIEGRYPFMDLKQMIDLQRRIVRSKRIVVDLSFTRYDVIKEICEQVFEWNIQLNANNRTDFNIQWIDSYLNEEDCRRLLPFQKINHFPGSQQLGRKNLLGQNLQKMRSQFQHNYNFYPKTWLLPLQYEDLKIHNQINYKSRPFYIIKPEASCQGKGIYLTNKIDSLYDNPGCVVQEYVKNPLLIDGLKFDLRLYVLLKNIKPLKIFLFQEGLARFATVPYKQPSKSNANNLLMHLTNYALNKKSEEFIQNQDISSDHIGHKRSFSSVLKHLYEEGHDVETLTMEIRQIIVKTIISALPSMTHSFRTCQPNNKEGNEMCFEIYGFDIMIDSNLKPYLIEVNHTPSFWTDSPLDLEVKRHLIIDALQLVRVSSKQKQKYFETRVQQQIASRSMYNKRTKLIHNASILQQEEEEEELLSQQLQQEITEWEDNNMGAYLRIYPAQDDPLNYSQFFSATEQNKQLNQLKFQQYHNDQIFQDSQELQNSKLYLPHKEMIYNMHNNNEFKISNGMSQIQVPNITSFGQFTSIKNTPAIVTQKRPQRSISSIPAINSNNNKNLPYQINDNQLQNPSQQYYSSLQNNHGLSIINNRSYLPTEQSFINNNTSFGSPSNNNSNNNNHSFNKNPQQEYQKTSNNNVPSQFYSQVQGSTKNTSFLPSFQTSPEKKQQFEDYEMGFTYAEPQKPSIFRNGIEGFPQQPQFQVLKNSFPPENLVTIFQQKSFGLNQAKMLQGMNQLNADSNNTYKQPICIGKNQIFINPIKNLASVKLKPVEGLKINEIKQAEDIKRGRAQSIQEFNSSQSEQVQKKQEHFDEEQEKKKHIPLELSTQSNSLNQKNQKIDQYNNNSNNNNNNNNIKQINKQRQTFSNQTQEYIFQIQKEQLNQMQNQDMLQIGEEKRLQNQMQEENQKMKNQFAIPQQRSSNIQEQLLVFIPSPLLPNKSFSKTRIEQEKQLAQQKQNLNTTSRNRMAHHSNNHNSNSNNVNENNVSKFNEGEDQEAQINNNKQIQRSKSKTRKEQSHLPEGNPDVLSPSKAQKDAYKINLNMDQAQINIPTQLEPLNVKTKKPSQSPTPTILPLPSNLPLFISSKPSSNSSTLIPLEMENPKVHRKLHRLSKPKNEVINNNS